MSLWIQFGLYEHKNFLYLFVCDFIIIIIIYLFILYDLFVQQKPLGPPFNFNVNEKGQNPPNNSNALYNRHGPKWRDQLWAFKLVSQIQFYTSYFLLKF